MFHMLLLVLATCCDSLLMSMAYGVDDIHIPKKSIVVIASCGTFFLGISLLLGGFITRILPSFTTSYISFTILLVLGIVNLFQGQVKHYVRKHKREPIVIRIKEISFVIDIFLDEKQADADHSKTISMKEAMYLGIALSIDSLASGLAYGIGDADIRIVLLLSFSIGIIVIIVGSYIGKHVSSFLQFDISWISGVILIVLAFLRL